MSVSSIVSGDAFKAAKPRVWSRTPVAELHDGFPDGKSVLAIAATERSCAG
jgi:hypothetical protein